MTKKIDGRKYAIYSRKSKFTGKGESIENQIEMCKKYIHMQNENVLDTDILVYEDEGFSGGNTNRPKFKQMMKDIKDDKIGTVVCYRLDRISRNVGDFALMFNEFEDKKVDFLSITEHYDTSTPSGRAMLSMCTVFAQMERETIAERIRDNMHELAKSGRWLGGTTPTGYKSVPIVGSVTVDGKVRKAYMLEIVPDEAEVVKLIFAKFLETNSLTKTETYLIQNGINTKNGRSYTRFSIKNILQNPVYMTADKAAFDYFSNLTDIYAEEDAFNGKFAVMAYNKTFQKSGKANQTRDFNEWIIALGKHTPLISSGDWIKVQSCLLQNSSKAYRKPKSNVALLSGLLRCAKCGSFMRPKATKRFNADGEVIYSYLCELKEKSRMHNCDMKNPNGNELDKAVCEELRALAQDSSTLMENLKAFTKKSKVNVKEYEKERDILQKTSADNEKQIRNLVASLAGSEESAAAQYIKEEIDNLHKKGALIKAQIAELEEIGKTTVLSDLDLAVFESSLQLFADNLEAMPEEQKRQAIRTIVKSIYWDGEKVHLFLFGDDGNIDYKGLLPEPKCEDSE